MGVLAIAKVPAAGNKIKICQAGPKYATSSTVATAIATEKQKIRIARHWPIDLGMRMNKHSMQREKGEWNGEDGMKAAEAEAARINVRPRPNILPTQNASVSRCIWLRMYRLCIRQTWTFKNEETWVAY
jgi:hypothetical protein